MQSELGDWLRRHLKKGVCEQGSAAQEVLNTCGISVAELQEQWSNQRTTQLSIRACKYLFFLNHPLSLLFVRCTCQAQERT